MQIKLYGNGHFCNIPVQEIIDKYWKDETAPFSFEMSTAIGDETIAATAMLGEESPDTYPSIRLDSRTQEKTVLPHGSFWKRPMRRIRMLRAMLMQATMKPKAILGLPKSLMRLAVLTTIPSVWSILTMISLRRWTQKQPQN